MKDTELMFRDLGILLPILGGYERVVGSLGMVCTQRFVGPTDQLSGSRAAARWAYVLICQAYLPHTQGIPLLVSVFPFTSVDTGLVLFVGYMGP